METTLEVQVSIKDVLNGKFKGTLEKINGFLTEARGDAHHGTTYSASGVRDRLNQIKEAFEHDLLQMEKSLKVKME